MKKYIATFIIVFITFAIGSGIYNQINKDKTPGKAERLVCQKKVTSFERVFDITQLQAAQKILSTQGLKFTSSVEKAVYAKSKLFNFVKLKDTDIIFKNKLNSFKTNKTTDINISQQNDFKLSYYIYENDVKDPGKKTKKSKQYAGYVVTKLKNKKNKLIYQSQIDFMDFKGADTASSIECGVESLLTYK